MAAKVNVKFVGILFVALSVAAAIVIGLFLLQYRMDATRNVRTGDAAMESGNYRVAKVAYGRAVSKDQTNREFLKKYEEAILAHQPETREEAREWYADWLDVLAVDAQYRGADPATHQRLIKELVRRARLVDTDVTWQAVESAADRMWDVVDADHPDRILAKLYRGLAIGRRVSVLSSEEIASGEDDLNAVLEARPDSDTAWTALTMLQLATAERFRAEGRTSQFEAKLKELKETRDQGLDAVPLGFEMAMANARIIAYQRNTGIGGVTDADISDAVDRIVDLAEATDDNLLLLEYVHLMRELNATDALHAAVDLLRSKVEDDEQAIFERLEVARAYLMLAELDSAERFARSVIDAARLHTSLVSQAQYDLRREAARMLVDVAVRRWDVAGADEKPDMLEAVQAARAELKQYVAEDTDPLMLWADGRIAMIHEDYGTAAAKFEEFLRQREGADFETLMLTARALEQIEQFGAALRRMEQVRRALPTNVQVLANVARLQYNVGRPDEARRTLAEAEEIAPDHPAVVVLKEAMADRSRDKGEPEVLTEHAEANSLLLQAREAMEASDTEGALELARQAAQIAPDDLVTLKFLFNVEVAAGALDAARDVANRIQEIVPDDPDIERVTTLLSDEDPIAAIKAYITAQVDNETDRVIRLMVNMRALGSQQRSMAQRAERSGDMEKAQEARRLAERAAAEAEALVERAEELAPNDRTLIEHLFLRATMEKNWEEAERIVERAAEADADRVGGVMYQGRLDLMRGRYEQAVRAFLEATDTLSYSAYAWRLLGMAYQSAGNIADARRAYQRSYDNNPNDLTTLRLYCELMVRIGDSTRALQVLRSASNLLPDTSPAVEYWLNLESEHGDIALVLTRRRDMYERDRGNTTNALRLATLLGQVTPRRELILDETGTPRFSGNRWDRMPTTEQRRLLDEARDAWLDESEAILADLGDQGVRGLAVVRVRAKNALARDQAEEGEKLLRDFIRQQELKGALTIDHMLALGQYLSDAQQFQEARDLFVAARELQNPNAREADLMLADLYFRGGRYEQAAEIYQSVRDADVGGPTVGQRLAECYVRTRMFDEADEVLESLELDGQGDYVSAMLEAAIADGRGQDCLAEGREADAVQEFEKQRAALERATTLAPSQPMPYVQRANSYLSQYRREENPALLENALGALDTAESLRADYPAVSITRADVLNAQGRLDAAIGELGRLLERAPERVQVRRRLIELLLDSGRLNEASSVVLEATELFPDGAVWYELYGDLKVEQGDVNAAEPKYMRAYEIEPNRTRLAKVATARLRMAPPDPRAAAEILNAHQADFESDPAMRGIFAQALHGMGRPAEAREQMRLAYDQYRQKIAQVELAPSDISQWYITLRKLFEPTQLEEAEQFIRDVVGNAVNVYDLQWIARYWIDGGREGLSRSIEVQRQALEACPSSDTDLRVGLLNDLAQYYLRLDDYPNAIDTIEQLIEEQPENAMALNNLAYLMGDRGQDLETAIQHAAKANELKPNDPNILDTLGYLYMLSGQNEKAEAHLRESEQIFPMASTYLHLAKLMYERGDPRFRVETAIRRAEELNPDAKTRAEIDALLDDMREDSP